MTLFGFAFAALGLMTGGAGVGSASTVLAGPGFIRVMFITLRLGTVVLVLKSGKTKNKISACSSKETASAMDVLRLILIRSWVSPMGGKSKLDAMPV